jgi:hypothetical protein
VACVDHTNTKRWNCSFRCVCVCVCVCLCVIAILVKQQQQHCFKQKTNTTNKQHHTDSSLAYVEWRAVAPHLRPYCVDLERRATVDCPSLLYECQSQYFTLRIEVVTPMMRINLGRLSQVCCCCCCCCWLFDCLFVAFCLFVVVVCCCFCFCFCCLLFFVCFCCYCFSFHFHCCF